MLDVSLTELIQRAQESRLTDVWTAIPGAVESYDPTTRTADVRPLVKRPIFSESADGFMHEELPILPSIPVLFPMAGPSMITFPIPVGATGLVVIMTLSAHQWRGGATGSPTDPAEPGDHRLHHPGNAVFIPGIVPDGTSTPATAENALVVEAPEVRLGDHTATDLVALKSLVEARFAALAKGLVTAVPVAGDGGAAIKAAVLVALGDDGWSGYHPPNVGAAQVKAK